MGVFMCFTRNRFILVLSYVIYIFYVFVTLVSCILPSHVLLPWFFLKSFFLVFCVVFLLFWDRRHATISAPNYMLQVFETAGETVPQELPLRSQYLRVPNHVSRRVSVMLPDILL